MPYLIKPDNAPPPRQPQGLPFSVWAWLTYPLIPDLTAAGRRKRLLAWLLISILLLTLATIALVLIVNVPASPRRVQYAPFILGLDLFLLLAYGLNAGGHYSLAAGLTVSVASFAPWGALLIDPAILRGDVIPLAYTLLAVILCSILLSPRITALLAALQFAGVALLASTDPVSVNWSSLLALLFFTSVMSTLASIIIHGNLYEIDLQTHALAAREAEQRELSVRDHLTQLFNRRYLEETLAREIRRSVRSHHRIGVILFDIDQFKQVNDKWGHAAGDLLLQEIGGLASSQIRGGDIACRYGGDEFVLVMPEASLAATRLRADRLRELVRRLQLEYNGHPLGTITISAGAALYPDHGASVEALLNSVDKALYRAKEAGRDRVVLADKNVQRAGS